LPRAVLRAALRAPDFAVAFRLRVVAFGGAIANATRVAAPGFLEAERRKTRRMLAPEGPLASGAGSLENALCGVAQAGQEGVDAFEQHGGVLAELARGDEDVVGQRARLIGGMARARDVV
jgi:hypothetical protein